MIKFIIILVVLLGVLYILYELIKAVQKLSSQIDNLTNQNMTIYDELEDSHEALKELKMYFENTNSKSRNI